jgi:Uma2 family endonuclease
MVTKTQIPVEEYLATSFEGSDREYLDGQIVERKVGDMAHSELQGRLIAILYGLPRRPALYPRPELRLQTGHRRYRVADIAVFKDPKPTERIPSAPPHIVIEIVSPDDRFTEIVEKLHEYHRWGVPHIWLVDPNSRKLSVYGSAGLAEVPAFELPEFDLQLTFTDLTD